VIAPLAIFSKKNDNQISLSLGFFSVEVKIHDALYLLFSYFFNLFAECFFSRRNVPEVSKI